MTDDAELLRAYARRGDVASLSALVRRHAVWMQAMLRGMLRSPADADDAFQETWARVMKAAGSYRGGKVKSYLATVARSAAIDAMRRAGRFVPLDAADGERGESAAESVPDGSPDPGERFESSATAEDVRAAVCELPEGQRQVVLMRIEAEMTFREIADSMGVPLGTALTWMHSATIALRKRLGGA
ncbi:MAG: RNA polymerase sigma factor [Kiritimatiellae bacterium]|nr:RNA polymerase sigma factor [Kiritimatiellia bacterium]